MTLMSGQRSAIASINETPLRRGKMMSETTTSNCAGCPSSLAFAAASSRVASA
jgi:hypothetical protein